MSFTIPNLDGPTPPTYPYQSDLTQLDIEIMANSKNNHMFLINGGAVTVSSGRTLSIANGKVSTSGPTALMIKEWSTDTSKTLDDGDPTYPRRDVIYVDSNGARQVLKGDPSLNPLPKIPDMATSCILAVVDVPAGTGVTLTNNNIIDKRIIVTESLNFTTLKYSDFVSHSTNTADAAVLGSEPNNINIWRFDDTNLSEVYTKEMLILPWPHITDNIWVWLTWVNETTNSGDVKWVVKLWEFDHGDNVTKSPDYTSADIGAGTTFIMPAQSQNTLATAYNGGGSKLAAITAGASALAGKGFDYLNPIGIKVGISRDATDTTNDTLTGNVGLIGVTLITQRANI